MGKLLIVDDEHINLKIVTKFLKEEQNLEIFTALSGDEALALVDEVKPDLVLMDIFMPGRNGVEVTKIFRETYGNLQLPVILITASFDYNLKMEALSAGVDDFLNKPLDRIELITKVRLLMKNKSLHEMLEQNNKRMVHQLKLARQIQDKLQFRGRYALENLEIEASYFPMEEIGGDIIELRRISQRKLWVFLGDATGHGISAAMVSTLVKALIEGLPSHLNCCEVMKQLNNNLVSCFDGDLDDLYVTAIFCILDLDLNEIQWINAGHPEPLIQFKNSEAGTILFHSYVSALPLGIVSDYTYAQNCFSLEKVKEMTLYSDGLLSMVGGHIEDAQMSLLQHQVIDDLLQMRVDQQNQNYEDDVAIIRIYNQA